MTFRNSRTSHSALISPNCCNSVTFAGGFGAQMLSMAVLLGFESEGVASSADLSYFDSVPRIAKPGDKSASTWPWSLSAYGFSFKEVQTWGEHKCRSPIVLGDTPEKLNRAITALRRPEVARRFPLRDERKLSIELGIEATFLSGKFIAFHLRRGDYLNVSTRVLPDSLFLSAANRLKEISDSAIVFSDSKLSTRTRREFETLFPTLEVFDTVRLDPFLVHQTIRHASIFLGSNSQLSLVSGLLGKGAYLNPTDWFNRQKLDLIPNELGDFKFVS